MVFGSKEYLNYMVELDSLIPLVGRKLKYITDDDIVHISNVLIREYGITSEVFGDEIKNKRIVDFKKDYFNDRQTTIDTIIKYLAMLVDNKSKKEM